MSVLIQIPEKQLRLTRNLSFELFSEIKRVVSSDVDTHKCEHYLDEGMSGVFSSDGECIWYDEYQYCRKCLSSRLSISSCGGLSFIVYKVGNGEITFDEEWGQGVTVSYVPEDAVRLWNELKTDPSNVKNLRNLIDYYSS